MNPEKGVSRSAFVDERLRHSAADGKSLAHARGEVGGGDGEEFLVAVQTPAMLAGEHATDRRGFDSGQEEAGECEGDEIVDIVPSDMGIAVAAVRAGRCRAVLRRELRD